MTTKGKCEVCEARGVTPAPAIRRTKMSGESHRVRICSGARCKDFMKRWNKRQRDFSRLKG